MLCRGSFVNLYDVSVVCLIHRALFFHCLFQRWNASFVFSPNINLSACSISHMSMTSTSCSGVFQTSSTTWLLWNICSSQKCSFFVIIYSVPKLENIMKTNNSPSLQQYLQKHTRMHNCFHRWMQFNIVFWLKLKLGWFENMNLESVIKFTRNYRYRHKFYILVGIRSPIADIEAFCADARFTSSLFGGGSCLRFLLSMY